MWRYSAAIIVVSKRAYQQCPEHGAENPDRLHPPEVSAKPVIAVFFEDEFVIAGFFYKKAGPCFINFVAPLRVCRVFVLGWNFEFRDQRCELLMSEPQKDFVRVVAMTE